MLNKNFLLGCAVASLTACGGGDQDLGPNNPNFGAEPQVDPVVVVAPKAYTFDFEDAAQLDKWVSQDEGSVTSTHSIHSQVSALQLAPVGWANDDDALSAMGYTDEPVNVQHGKIYMSVFIPAYYTDQNPWNADGDDANVEDDRYNFGFQITLEDSLGIEATAGAWKNVYEMLGTSLNSKGFGFSQRTPDSQLTNLKGRWFDMVFEANKYADADDGFDITSITGVGIRLTLKDINADLELITNTEYVYVDSILLEPLIGDAPVEPELPPPAPISDAGGFHPTTNAGLVFFDWDGKDSWWDDVGLAAENDAELSADGTNYGRVNFETGSIDWKGLFWRNGSTMNGQAIVADNIDDYSLKFDINIFSPIDAGVIKIRFKSDDEDVFYDWAPWTDSGEAFSTNGWETIVIPLADIGVSDYSLVNSDFGMAFEGADILLDFAIDNVRFDAPRSQALSSVDDTGLVFFDWDGKDSWWDDVGTAAENDAAISVDGTNYARINYQTGSEDWKGLFWRNGGDLQGKDIVGTDSLYYSLKFDINVMSAIDAGVVKIRFKGDDFDAFYEWAPWGTDNPYLTDGWVTVDIPLTEIGVEDYSLVTSDFGMAFEGADILLDLAIDNVRFEKTGGPDPVADPELVFFDWDGKDSWWDDVGMVAENDAALSVDGTNYGRVNFETGSIDWKGLFWRNGSTMNGQATVADNIPYYVLKFDINVLSPIDAGVVKIRFKGDDFDAFYDWAPWTDSGTPFSTVGWTTISIPLSALGVEDFSLVTSDFGMAFEGADILLDFAIDNVRFEVSEETTPVVDADLVFFDWDGKDSWWDDVGLAAENEAALSIDGTNYGRVNVETGSVDWKGLFWRNGSTMNGQATVADNLDAYVLKFDFFTLAPITDGVFKIRFKSDSEGFDAFYEWAPWSASGSYVTDGWKTITIPLSALGVPDFSLVDSDFGMAFEGADILLNFAIDNVRFEALPVL